ncbi:peptidoglycan/LPS O-acetylase OafA/YrhL [Kineothrix alysoides]|uniref:Peptidoglycan/LPS O-acetylase OafA/YrhL n=1 Tax=Kineothrix alysoides TaxID=1469948 RepID=A0A4R1QPP5_9FIRM|nr:acyltransferase [Kineothrix alysoides]TCL54853.1 peptidoglycan/LPS O-acetylase OafA/YrhL [Kineothrix alysoides]
MENKRLNYLDNIRWITVVLVIIYHIIYLFNNSGVISNINVKGIPVMDTFLIFVYPWFMCLLFVVSGISIRYSLEKRSGKEFIKDRAQRILVPSLLGIFIYGWISSVITNQYVDMFAGNGDKIPGIIKYLVYCLAGIGPLWFCHVLFIGSLLIVLIRKIDKKDKLTEMSRKINLPVLFAMVFLVWGSSFILNTPLITVYRFGIYLFMMLLGYYVFSNQELIIKLEKISIPLAIASIVIGIVYVATYYGQNFADNNVLNDLFTNIYLWIGIVSILGIGNKLLNFENKFTQYMTRNNFNFYILHYVVELLLGYFIVTYLDLPFMINYIIILLGVIIILPPLIEIVKRIPIIRYMVLGIKKRNSD